jgi:hypothetical protein
VKEKLQWFDRKVRNKTGKGKNKGKWGSGGLNKCKRERLSWDFLLSSGL